MKISKPNININKNQNKIEPSISFDDLYDKGNIIENKDVLNNIFNKNGSVYESILNESNNLNFIISNTGDEVFLVSIDNGKFLTIESKEFFFLNVDKKIFERNVLRILDELYADGNYDSDVKESLIFLEKNNLLKDYQSLINIKKLLNNLDNFTMESDDDRKFLLFIEKTIDEIIDEIIDEK